MNTRKITLVCGLSFLLMSNAAIAVAQSVDLSEAAIVLDAERSPLVVRTAATVLQEELGKRTGLELPILTHWPSDRPVIALVDGKNSLLGKRIPKGKVPSRAEGFCLRVVRNDQKKPILWIHGADGRGVLFGVGFFLRQVVWSPGRLRWECSGEIGSAPAFPIRGHQLGYRDVANSYDAWDEKQYEQYIRELTFWGTNSIENIPVWGDTLSPVMKRTPQEMNRAISEICNRYDLDYWVWIPAQFDLNDKEKRAAFLEQQGKLFADSPRLDAVFFPGGDPGNNPPELVLPYLEDLALVLLAHHPRAKIWLSMQSFTPEEVDAVFAWISAGHREWFAGLVAGPSSPPIPETRARLSKAYRLRHYPDITHSVRAQYPVPWWDPAFAFTLGREATNPRPVYYALIHNLFAPYTDGFVTYSDGVHDDVNKVVWSARGWDPKKDVRSILVEYARVFWKPELAERAADAILALEKNWQGAAAENGAIDSTLTVWQSMERAYPELAGDWRWQQCLLRAYYDAYIRHRLIHESELEREANDCLLMADKVGSGKAIAAALAVLDRATPGVVQPEWRGRIIELCARLYDSIGLQTSTPNYHAHNPQRGAVLDFVDLPLNNRWWLEDELEKVRALPDENSRVVRLRELALWEEPVPDSFYDDIGNVAKSPHVVRDPEPNMTMPLVEPSGTGCMWWENGKPRCRQSWVTYMDWPKAMRYSGLDPEKRYVIRTTGYVQCLLRIDGERVTPTVDGKGIGEIKEFPVPAELYKDSCIELTFDVPHEPGVNWRYTSRLTEVWLIPVP